MRPCGREQLAGHTCRNLSGKPRTASRISSGGVGCVTSGCDGVWTLLGSDTPATTHSPGRGTGLVLSRGACGGGTHINTPDDACVVGTGSGQARTAYRIGLDTEDGSHSLCVLKPVEALERTLRALLTPKLHRELCPSLRTTSYGPEARW